MNVCAKKQRKFIRLEQKPVSLPVFLCCFYKNCNLLKLAKNYTGSIINFRYIPAPLGFPETKPKILPIYEDNREERRKISNVGSITSKELPIHIINRGNDEKFKIRAEYKKCWTFKRTNKKSFRSAYCIANFFLR